jgi:hypothetical protein
MPEDATRRLLRAFGIAVTDCEDALSELEAVLHGPDTRAVPREPLDAYDRASRELEVRWAEIDALVLGYRARGREALVAALRARGSA